MLLPRGLAHCAGVDPRVKPEDDKKTVIPRRKFATPWRKFVTPLRKFVIPRRTFVIAWRTFVIHPAQVCHCPA